MENESPLNGEKGQGDHVPLLTVAHISCILHMHESSVQRILSEDLKKRSYCAKWIPYSLTDLHKQQRVVCAQQILNNISGNVVVIDEKWLYAKPHPNQHTVCAGEIQQEIARSCLEQKLHPKNFISSLA